MGFIWKSKNRLRTQAQVRGTSVVVKCVYVVVLCVYVMVKCGGAGWGGLAERLPQLPRLVRLGGGFVVQDLVYTER